MSKHLVIVGRKVSPLTGRNLRLGEGLYLTVYICQLAHGVIAFRSIPHHVRFQTHQHGCSKNPELKG